MPRVVYLARHGETDWNVQQRWQGHTDVPLNANGRVQARLLAIRLRSVGLGGVVCSDLARAHETARIVAAELGLPLACVDARLRERTVGIFEGLTGEDCERLHPDAWRAWCERKRPPPGWEEPSALTLRALAGIERVALEVARDDAPALVVSHGGLIRSLVAEVTGRMPPPIGNGGAFRIAWDRRIVSAEPF
jgi:probable phosphoglycerate mutase